MMTSQKTQSNGSAENERLSMQVRELQAECARLLELLAASEELCNWYRKALIEVEQAKREFEDVDIPSLEAISAGPVDVNI